MITCSLTMVDISFLHTSQLYNYIQTCLINKMISRNKRVKAIHTITKLLDFHPFVTPHPNTVAPYWYDL